MKNAIKIFTALTKGASFCIGLTAYQQMIPTAYLPTAIIIFAGASAVKEIGLILCDYLDDGIRNDSFKLPLIAALLFCAALLTSCGLTSAQWASIGKDVLFREAPLVFSQVQAAKTSAKQPLPSIQPK